MELVLNPALGFLRYASTVLPVKPACPGAAMMLVIKTAARMMQPRLIRRAKGLGKPRQRIKRISFPRKGIAMAERVSSKREDTRSVYFSLSWVRFRLEVIAVYRPRLMRLPSRL